MTTPAAPEVPGGAPLAPIPSTQFLGLIHTDPHLVHQLQAIELDTADTVELLASFERFNATVHVQRRNGTEYIDDLFYLRRFANELPQFLEGARGVGLSDPQITGMVRNMLDSNPYDFSQRANEDSLWGYGTVFTQKAARGETVDEREYGELQDFIRLTARAGVMDNAGYALVQATRIGLSTEQALAIIAPLPERDGSMSGYTFGPFNGALRALVSAEVNGDDVVQVFTALSGERPYFSQQIYQLFEELVVLDGPLNRRTPQNLLDMIKARLGAGQNIEEALTGIARETQQSISSDDAPEVEVIDVAQATADYFPAKEGKLEVLGLPYRTQRSLEAGLQDLLEIAQAQLGDRIELGEGMWTYDPATETWYSLGGKLELGAGYVRNNFVPYDISLLSATPLLFHTHPDSLGAMIRPHRGDGAFPDEFVEEVGDLVSMTPSRADYDVLRHFIEGSTRPHQPRAFIVHKGGITEYVYPQDAGQVEDLSQHSRDIRDRVILEADWRRLRRRAGRIGIADALVADLSSRLPAGFSLRQFGIDDLVRNLGAPKAPRA